MKRRLLLLSAVVFAAWGWRWSGLGTRRRARSAQAGLGLVFDGGPDAVVTPALLGALAAADVRATFALTAAGVRAQPLLARRVVQEGHDVAVLVTGFRGGPEVRAVQAALDCDVIGVSLGARPGLLAWVWARLSGWPVVLGQGRGWTAHGPLGVRPGALVHLPGQDERLAAALPGWLEDLREREFEVLPLRDLRGLRPERLRDLPATALQQVDVWYDRVGRIRRVGNRASSLFRAGAAPFPLADLDLRDGGRVQRGERLAEFHLDSARLTELAERPVAGRRIVTASVRDLARALRDDPDLNTFPAVFSISIFSDVLGLYGFTVVDLPPAHRRRLTWWSRVIRRAYGVSDPQKQHVPKLAVMSREAFVARHARP